MMDDKMITAQRIADFLTARGIAFEQKKMFGGICFMVNDKMLTGANRHNKLLARVDPADEDLFLQRPGGVSIMEMGPKLAHGFLFVDPAGFDKEEDFTFWMEKCLEYNPKAKKHGLRG